MPKDLPVITLQDVVMGDLRGMKISVSPLRATIVYVVRDQDSEAHHNGTITGAMPAQLKQDLSAWITGTVLPAINIQEDLV